MGEELDELDQILREHHQSILQLPFGRARLDLMHLYQNADKIKSECSKELVRCRRLGIYTVGYRENAQALRESLTNLGHFLTIAHLIKH